MTLRCGGVRHEVLCRNLLRVRDGLAHQFHARAGAACLHAPVADVGVARVRPGRQDASRRARKRPVVGIVTHDSDLNVRETGSSGEKPNS